MGCPSKLACTASYVVRGLASKTSAGDVEETAPVSILLAVPKTLEAVHVPHPLRSLHRRRHNTLQHSETTLAAVAPILHTHASWVGGWVGVVNIVNIVNIHTFFFSFLFIRP